MTDVKPDNRRSRIVRAHMSAAGAPQKKGGQDSQALGRSSGGISCKIHVSVDALGNRLRLTSMTC